jgi:hypothetical protein
MSGDDNVITKRIVNHMNKDHVHNIEDFLVVYANVDSEVAQRNPRMETINLGSMSLSYIDMQGTKCVVRIPFQPSLDSLNNARSKLVEISQKAAQKRGFSEYLVNKVPFLTTTSDYIAIIVFFILYLFAIKQELLKYILDEFFQFPDNINYYILNYHTTFFRVLIGLHSIEAIGIVYPILRKHRMSTLKKIAALFLTLIEGVLFFKAYQREIQKAQNPKSKKEK